MIILVCLASLIPARTDLHRAGAQAPHRGAAGGQRRFDIHVDAHSNDEFGDLGNAFNDMARSLRTKQELLDDQQRENDRLLLSLMPEALARRYREGEETIAEDHRDVSVIFADLVGFDEFSADLSSAAALALLNGLTRASTRPPARPESRRSATCATATSPAAG